jgi:hypothetical protein
MENDSKFRKKKYYEFQLLIDSIKIEYKIPFNFRILLKGNNRNYEIDKTFKYDCKEEFININEEILLAVNNTNDTNDFRFKIYISIFTKTGFKPAISEEINLNDFVFEDGINNGNNEITCTLKEISMSNKTFKSIVLKYSAKENYNTKYENLGINELNTNYDNSNLIIFNNIFILF